MLFIVSTPIGNLEDITLRAINILKNCTYVLCEDSRKSRILFNHYSIATLLLPFHKFNEKKLEDKVIQDLENNYDIALISDGGTPLISDPGLLLVQKCIEKGISVSVAPGPCSVIAALTISGFDTQKFQFIGFLPKKQKALETALQSCLEFDGTSICFESPYRLLKTLKKLFLLDPNCKIAVVREVSKKFEEVVRGYPEEILKAFENRAVKGEIVILFETKNGS